MVQYITMAATAWGMQKVRILRVHVSARSSFRFGVLELLEGRRVARPLYGFLFEAAGSADQDADEPNSVVDSMQSWSCYIKGWNWMA